MVCIYVRAFACTLLIYIRTAWATVLLFVTKAIPEPQNAEQQDCSPAFLLYICPFEIVVGHRCRGIFFRIFLYLLCIYAPLFVRTG